MSAPASTPSQRWLFGAVPDLLLGCGLLYMAVFALGIGVGSQTLASWIPGGLLVMAAGIPHYGATLLRVYESSEDRRKYVYFAVHASVVLALLFVASLYNAWLGSLVLTIYLTWSPWHYTGQNYGIFLMLLGRRGVKVTPTAKRFVYAAFLLSYALTFTAIHGVERSANYAPVSYQGSVFHLMPLGLPGWLTGPLMPLLALAYVSCLAIAVGMLLRGARLRDIAPSLVLMGTQALWFVIPVGVRYWGAGIGVEGVYTAYGFIWVAFGHSVQYLWVTTYYARASRAESGNFVYLAKTVLAGYAIWTLPALLFAPGLLGRLPYESGLALQVAAVVNLHHFVLDGAIWKLRDGRIGRILLRSREAAADAEHPGGGPALATSGGPWLGRMLWALGVGALVVAVLASVEGAVGHRGGLAAGNIDRARQASRHLAWMGRDGPSIHREIGVQLANRGRMEEARRAFERSLELHPTLETWMSMGRLHEVQEDWKQAVGAYEQAVALDSNRVQALYRLALAWLELGEPERAKQKLERVVALAPDQPIYGLSLERARIALGEGTRAADGVEAPSTPAGQSPPRGSP